jgi:hypothetical protein
MDFDLACQAKWKDGIAQYRNNENEPFNGEHCEEAFQECIDLHNILGDMEQKFKINLSIFKGMTRQIGTMLKAQSARIGGQ